MTYAIGIDLGTTNCAAAIVQSGQHGPTVKVLKNSNEKQLTPSWIYYDKGDSSNELKKVFGTDAQTKAQFKPQQGVYDAKRIIGLKYNDERIQDKISSWPFSVVEDSHQNPKIELNMAGVQTVQLAPQQVSADLLKYIKTCAEKELEGTVSKAVISVPAYFTDAQRHATMEAARIAGLEVLQLFAEPTSASLAYRFDRVVKQNKEIKTLLVYDFGGGTFDVSVVELRPDKVHTLATDGDLWLGGQDFTTQVTRLLVDRVQEQTDSFVQDNSKAMYRLRAAAENAKKELSFTEEHIVELDNLIDDEDFEVTLTRKELEDLFEEDIEETINIMRNCLQEIHLEPRDIDEVLMIGGTTRIPKIHQMVKEFFNQKTLCCQINPDEAVAVGAAFQAAQLSDQVPEGEMVPVTTVCPSSYGIKVRGTYMGKLIAKNSEVPCHVTEDYYTQGCFQTNVEIVVLEGEHELSKHNKVLGKFTLTDIDPRNDPIPMEVSFQVNINGIFVISATEKNTTNRKEITITSYMP